MAAVLGLTACSNQTADRDETTSSAAAAATEEAAENTEQGDTAGTAETAQAAEEETVSLTIPTVYESVSTQEEADTIRDKNGYISATLNEDGSLTIVMTRADHEQMVQEFESSVEEAMQSMIGSDSFPNITDIEVNEDYSSFTVTTSSEEVDSLEAIASNELVMYGTLYHIYTGNDVDNIRVDFVSADSEETLKTVESGSLKKAFESAAENEETKSGTTEETSSDTAAAQ